MVTATGLQSKAGCAPQLPLKLRESEGFATPPGTAGMARVGCQWMSLQGAKLNPSCQKCLPSPLVEQQGVLGGVKSIGQLSGLGLWKSISEENIPVLVFGVQGK